jgi:hypothetical protein
MIFLNTCHGGNRRALPLQPMRNWIVVFVIFLQAVAFSMMGQSTQEVLAPRQLMKLLPDKLKGYEQLEDSKSSEIKIGNITYSLCEKVFNRNKNNVKVLIFDFNNAQIMFDQMVRPWRGAEEVNSDTVKQRHMQWEGNQGWESENTFSKTAQVFVAVNNRFIMSIIGESSNLNDLHEVLSSLDASKFPQ